jgi:dynein regulatory complex protein 1
MASSAASASKAGPGATPEDSLWDVDFEKADQRISARRARIANRLDAARKIKKMIQVKHVFVGGYHSQSTRETFPVEAQCDASRGLLDNVLDNGSELVSNVRLAADHLQVQHRVRHDARTEALTTLLATEDAETTDEVEKINQSWPGDDVQKRAPMDLYEKIMDQKSACNELLRKRNDLISILDSEIKDSDNQYKTLIEEYHENTSVLASRMESQIQALEGLIRSERKNLIDAYGGQKADHLKRNERNWQVKLEAVNRTAEDQMEERLKALRDQEKELDEIILADSEAFIEMKHKMEQNIATLADQIQLLDAVHQMNEERLDYEIHVLRKHEEEIVLVKSEQKRKITIQQDTINKLRRKVRSTNSHISREETSLHESIASIRQQLEKLYNKKRAYSAYTNRKRADISSMVREEVQKDIERIVDTDFILQKLYMTRKPRRLEVFDEDLLKDLSAVQEDSTHARGTAGTRSRHLSGMSEKTDPTSGSFSLDETDEALKGMLSTLVHEANFLVEDNLSLLVDDIPEDERNLFKLDSILTAIGLQGEQAVINVLRQHEKNPSKAMEGILKIIRNQIEAKKREKEQSMMATSQQSLSHDRGGSKPLAGGGQGGGVGFVAGS